jgi:succinyl-CoA synthetase beta subunit
MNLHEYQGKSILKHFGVPIQEGIVANTVEEAINAAKELQKQTGTKVWVVKAQIHAGGRGKAGGVKVATDLDKVKEKATTILGMNLISRQTGPKGRIVRKILIAQDVYYDGPGKTSEFYLSILLNRQKGRNMIIYSPAGGMEIEEVSKNSPDKIFKEEIDPKVGLQPFQARKIAFNFGLSGEAFKNMVKFVSGVYKAYEGADASLVEINPVLKATDDKIVAVDCKMVLDNSALYRHPDYAEMRDTTEEDPMEVEAGKYKLNYVQLDGNVGCMVNGAGLAMATMDIIKLAGGSPANFLDVGGTANAERVEHAFRIILSEPQVKAILVNIFGGIVQCDRVAQGIVDAYKNIGEIKVPIIVRLQGTKSAEAKKLIDESGLKVQSAILLQEAADLVTKVLK